MSCIKPILENTCEDLLIILRDNCDEDENLSKQTKTYFDKLRIELNKCSSCKKNNKFYK